MKKEISKKQSEHLKNARIKMIETEREKKMVMKKVKELISLNVNLDDVIENAKKLKVKKDYERMYGRKQDEEELVEPVNRRDEIRRRGSFKS